jgi:hypothetical protein
MGKATEKGDTTAREDCSVHNGTFKLLEVEVGSNNIRKFESCPQENMPQIYYEVNVTNTLHFY